VIYGEAVLSIESGIFWLILMVAFLSFATYHLFTPPRPPRRRSSTGPSRALKSESER